MFVSYVSMFVIKFMEQWPSGLRRWISNPRIWGSNILEDSKFDLAFHPSEVV